MNSVKPHQNRINLEKAHLKAHLKVHVWERGKGSRYNNKSKRTMINDNSHDIINQNISVHIINRI